jgi:hypothetical protein
VASRLPVFSALALAYSSSGQQRQAPSAGDVFARFCKLDAQGGQLTHDGWRTIAALFVNPGTHRHDRIIVTDGCGSLGQSSEGEPIAVGRECIEYGQIDLPQVRFSALDGLPPGVKIHDLYNVVKIPTASGMVWRIEGPVLEPRLNVATAIRYVIELRANAKDAIVKKNADRTLAALRHFR